MDYEKMEILKKSARLSPKDIRKIQGLLKKVEFINLRKNTLHRLLEVLLVKQAAYFRSGRLTDLLPLTRKAVAREIAVNVSTVSRAIKNRSLLTPEREERPIESFFPHSKEKQKELIYEIISSEKHPYPDIKIRDMAKDKYGMDISRRTIADYRREMKISSSYRRKRDEFGRTVN